MTNDIEIPTQSEFMAAPVEAVAAVAPQSMVYAPGGTRRSAIFAGVEPWTPAYLDYLRERFVEALTTIFRYGVKHVFTPMVMVSHTHEVTDVARQLVLPMGEFITNRQLLEVSAAHGWRLRIAASAYGDLLAPYVDRLRQNTPQDAAHTWWWSCTPTQESWWSNLFALIKRDHIRTRADAIRALYGEDVPPITLCLAFGKPMTSPDLFPPLLMDNVQCYWSQQVGGSLTDLQFRKVLYDYAYLRRTWQKDKTTRAKQAQHDQALWEQEVILGLGKRVGPFWYPSFPHTPPA